MTEAERRAKRIARIALIERAEQYEKYAKWASNEKDIKLFTENAENLRKIAETI